MDGDCFYGAPRGFLLVYRLLHDDCLSSAPASCVFPGHHDNNWVVCFQTAEAVRYSVLHNAWQLHSIRLSISQETYARQSVRLGGSSTRIDSLLTSTDNYQNGLKHSHLGHIYAARPSIFHGDADLSVLCVEYGKYLCSNEVIY